MPSAVLQAAFGINNVPAYRGTCYLVIDNENLTSTGGAIPQYAFEVERSEGFTLTSKPYPLEAVDNMNSAIAGVRPAPEALTRDAMGSTFLGLSGDLRSILSSYDNYAPESFSSTFLGVSSGELRSILSSYDHYEPELLSATFLWVASGELRSALITYDNAEPESFTSTFLGISGDLQ
ncbi:hypothetical protein ACJJID_01445 [Microbulbifer sp. CnH-101-G]|uniref:hypothetical protein n=1 Tax=Microbulbifer sp. CnH-101-G TaxID=3243393 RepID=UPI0040396BF2